MPVDNTYYFIYNVITLKGVLAMKQRKKKSRIQVPAPRATHVNEVLMSKKCEKHEEKDGPKAKRAKQKQAVRKEIKDVLKNIVDE